MNNKSIIFAGMGFELVGMILGGLFLGQKMDEHWNLGGLCTAAMSFIVLIGWMWHLVILIQKFQKDNEVSENTSSKNSNN